jgi:hypothetical protein
LSIGGDKSLGVALGTQAKLIAPDVTVIVLKDTGHCECGSRATASLFFR